MFQSVLYGTPTLSYVLTMFENVRVTFGKSSYYVCIYHVPLSYSPPAGVVQMPSAVGKLGRLGPKLLTALIRKRKVAQPGRFKVTDVMLGLVTLYTSLKTDAL